MPCPNCKMSDDEPRVPEGFRVNLDRKASSTLPNILARHEAHAEPPQGCDRYHHRLIAVLDNEDLPDQLTG